MNFQNLISLRRANVKKIHFFIFSNSDNFFRIFFIFFTIREHYWLHLGQFLATLPKSSSDLYLGINYIILILINRNYG